VRATEFFSQYPMKIMKFVVYQIQLMIPRCGFSHGRFRPQSAEWQTSGGSCPNRTLTCSLDTADYEFHCKKFIPEAEMV
jgi:hypothetical protein